MKPRKRQAKGTVTIDGTAIAWELRREAHYSSSEGHKGMQFSARSVSITARTFRELILEFPFPPQKPGKPFEKERIVPEKVEAAIREAIAGGWEPNSRGRVFIWTVENTG